MPGRTRTTDADALQERLSTQIPKILDQGQNTTANHQKNIIALHKLQVEAAELKESLNKGRGFRLVGEKVFEDVMLYMLMRVLPVKKGVSQADRIVKFLGQFVKFINEKAAEEKQEGDEDEDDEATASRFTARLLKSLFKGFESKDKWVRYRVLQTVAEMVSHLGEVDEDLYKELRALLLERVNDRETAVRVQAVIALSKLSGSEDPSEVEEGEPTVLDVLLDIMTHDTSPDVRRAVLLNIPVNETTLPKILDRTRDVDTVIRKLVYGIVLESNVTVGETDDMGPAHPRALSITQRELVIRNGLGDREASVRGAASSLLGRWVDVIGQPLVKAEGEDDKKDVKIESGVVELLKMLDLTEGSVAADAVLSIFTVRTEIFENIEFGNDYWANLTQETAFLARVFVDHCKATKDDVRLEAALPVVTELAYRIQAAYNKLLEDMEAEEEEQLVRDLNEEEKVRLEEARIERESIIGELLRLAVSLDYSDEIGRRKMFQLVREMLSQDVLPESLFAKCLDILRELSANERDLIRVVVEIVQDLRDRTGEEEDPNKDDDEAAPDDTPTTVKPARNGNKAAPAEPSPQEKARADAIDLRCLLLCNGMLERVNGTLEENSSLDGILTELILPSVRRKELIFRETGLVSMGLCCLIAKRLAINSIMLFIRELINSPEALKPSLIQIVFDVLMVHVQDLRREKPEDYPKIVPCLLQLLGSETSDKVQALLCIGISKLVLSGIITDETVVINLIQSYLSPVTADNQELRQCLAFFFPVYCYSSPAHQSTMRRIFLRTYKELNKDREELEDDEEMLSAVQVAALFVEWTDPTKLHQAVNAQGNADNKHQVDTCVQLDMAIDVLKSILQEKWEKDDRKVLSQLLGKLYIPDEADDAKIKELKVLTSSVEKYRRLRDSVANNALKTFDVTFTKRFSKQLEDFNEENYRKLEQLNALFEFVDSIIPDDDDDIVDLDEPRKGRKRRSESIITTTTESEEPSSNTSRPKPKPKSKRRRLSESDDESDVESTEAGTPPAPAAPTRTLPKRSAATRKPQMVDLTFDSDDEPPTPVASKRTKQSSSIKPEPEGEITQISYDSIIDGDEEDEDEDEEEEVSGLLAEE